MGCELYATEEDAEKCREPQHDLRTGKPSGARCGMFAAARAFIASEARSDE